VKIGYEDEEEEELEYEYEDEGSARGNRQKKEMIKASNTAATATSASFGEAARKR